MSFRVGQKVVYIAKSRTPNHGHGDEERPVYGNTYTIRGFSETARKPSIFLEEIVNAPQEYLCGDGRVRLTEICFWAESFRPIVKTDISIFHEIARKVTQGERVGIDA